MASRAGGRLAGSEFRGADDRVVRDAVASDVWPAVAGDPDRLVLRVEDDAVVGGATHPEIDHRLSGTLRFDEDFAHGATIATRPGPVAGTADQPMVELIRVAVHEGVLRVELRRGDQRVVG